MPTEIGGKAARRSCAMLALAVLVSAAGCNSGSTGPTVDIQEIAGTYVLTQLTFDPQGVLPEADILATLGTTPQLVVTANKAAQIFYEDPITSLFVTIGASVRTTTEGLRVNFNSGSSYASLLLSRQMRFTYNAQTKALSFDGDAPEGVNRTRLVQLVPDWSNEQLLSPVPGRLRVTFQIQ